MRPAKRSGASAWSEKRASKGLRSCDASVNLQSMGAESQARVPKANSLKCEATTRTRPALMRTIILSLLLLPLASADTVTHLNPGGWALCQFLSPSLGLCAVPVDANTAPWFAFIESDAPPDVVAFEVAVTLVDGSVKTFLVRRNPDDLSATSDVLRIGKTPVKEVRTALLRKGDVTVQVTQ